jgi:hypothetical protein
LSLRDLGCFFELTSLASLATKNTSTCDVWCQICLGKSRFFAKIATLAPALRVGEGISIHSGPWTIRTESGEGRGRFVSMHAHTHPMPGNGFSLLGNETKRRPRRFPAPIPLPSRHYVQTGRMQPISPDPGESPTAPAAGTPRSSPRDAEAPCFVRRLLAQGARKDRQLSCSLADASA